MSACACGVDVSSASGGRAMSPHPGAVRHVDEPPSINSPTSKVYPHFCVPSYLFSMHDFVYTNFAGGFNIKSLALALPRHNAYLFSRPEKGTRRNVPRKIFQLPVLQVTTKHMNWEFKVRLR